MVESTALMAAGAVLASVGIAWSLLRRRRVSRALDLAGEPQTKGALEDGAEVTVEGTLRAPKPLVTRVPAGSEAPVRAVLGAESEIPDDARVEIAPDAFVLLDGAAQVVVGSEEHASRGGSVHTVRDGDWVRARGRVVRAPVPASIGADTRGYRESAHAHRFDPRSAPTVVVAESGPRAFTPPWLLVLFGVPLVGFGVWSRTAASAPRGACVAEVDALLAKDDLLGLGAVACDDPLAKARIAFASGDFGDAHASFAEARRADPSRPPTVAEIQSAALAEDFASAHALTVDLGKVWYPGPVSTEKTRMDCIADAWSSRASGGARTGTLVKPKRDDLWCNFLAADLEADHDARMWALQCDDDDYDTRRLLFLEAGEKGSWFVGDDGRHSYIEDYPLGALYDPAGWVAKRHIELEDAVAAVLDRGETSFELLAQAALYRAVMDDAPAAKKFLERMAKPGASRSPYILGAIAAIYAHDADLADRLLDLGANDANAVGVIRRSVMPLLRGMPTGAASDEPWTAEIDAAIHAHDANKLAEAFAKDGRTNRYEALRVRAVFEPRELGPLRTWLREKFPAPAWDHGVTAVGLRLGDELALADAFGDDALAAVLRPRVEKFEKAIASRPATPRPRDASFADDLLERAQDKPAEVWRMHY